MVIIVGTFFDGLAHHTYRSNKRIAVCHVVAGNTVLRAFTLKVACSGSDFFSENLLSFGKASS